MRRFRKGLLSVFIVSAVFAMCMCLSPTASAEERTAPTEQVIVIENVPGSGLFLNQPIKGSIDGTLPTEPTTTSQKAGQSPQTGVSDHSVLYLLFAVSLIVTGVLLYKERRNA